MLFQIPQRYRFSSKSQHEILTVFTKCRCFRYHKGTDFQANHNYNGYYATSLYVVLDTTKVQIFKQITTHDKNTIKIFRCFRYHKGTDFQANHNDSVMHKQLSIVVLDTTKVQIFKQITTSVYWWFYPCCCFRYHKGTDFQANHNCMCSIEQRWQLFQIPQRYRFSSKSQLSQADGNKPSGCFRYHKGTDFQANHN